LQVTTNILQVRETNILQLRFCTFNPSQPFTMTFDQFRESLSEATPPDELSSLLQAMWFDAKGNWEKAHTIAQDVEHVNGAWVHAYLHRREGDAANAGYWYRKAARPMPTETLDEEWRIISTELLSQLF
jgi:hypothetical protein